MASASPKGVRRRLSRRLQVSLVVESALVGLVAGAIVCLYRMSLSAAEGLLRRVVGVAGSSAVGVLGWLFVLAALLALVTWLVRWEPATSGSGIPQVDAEVMGQLDMPWHRVIPAKFVEGSALALAGLSLGREGPSVQLGGMSGKAVSRALGRDRGEERLLVTCGAAAGMSAAFHAPLTGVLFALEEIHKQFTAPLIITVMSSSIVADYLVSQVLGAKPVLEMAFSMDLPRLSYPFVVLLGVLCGVAGALHNRGMFRCQELLSRIPSQVVRFAVPFAMAGVVAFVMPQLMCGGDAILEGLLSGPRMGLATMVLLLVAKYLFTTVCFGSGAPGGTLFPLVVMGALLGGIFSCGCASLAGVPESFFPNFVALGVAGLFSGVVRAPVTAVVLVFELTGSLDALLSASIVSIISYLVANLLRTDGFYEHLLANLLGTTTEDPAVSGMQGGKVLRALHVAAGSRIEGKLIRDVDWPEATRVLMVERAGAEVIAEGDTRLMALDELLFVVDEDRAHDPFGELQALCAAPMARRAAPEGS